MLHTVKNAMYTIGDSTEHLAKRVGSGTADLAKRIGPKRALIGLIVIGSVVGGSYLLMRYLRSRKEDLPFEGSEEHAHGKSAKRGMKRGEAQFSH